MFSFAEITPSGSDPWQIRQSVATSKQISDEIVAANKAIIARRDATHPAISTADPAFDPVRSAHKASPPTRFPKSSYLVGQHIDLYL